MPSLKGKDVESNLRKKGFSDSSGVKHKFLVFVYGGIKTHTSHNGQDVDDYLQSEMGKQVKLTKKQFYDFASCKMTMQEYITILKKKREL